MTLYTVLYNEEVAVWLEDLKIVADQLIETDSRFSDSIINFKPGDTPDGQSFYIDDFLDGNSAYISRAGVLWRRLDNKIYRIKAGFKNKEEEISKLKELAHNVETFYLDLSQSWLSNWDVIGFDNKGNRVLTTEFPLLNEKLDEISYGFEGYIALSVYVRRLNFKARIFDPDGNIVRHIPPMNATEIWDDDLAKTLKTLNRSS